MRDWQAFEALGMFDRFPDNVVVALLHEYDLVYTDPDQISYVVVDAFLCVPVDDPIQITLPTDDAGNDFVYKRFLLGGKVCS